MLFFFQIYLIKPDFCISLYFILFITLLLSLHSDKVHYEMNTVLYLTATNTPIFYLLNWKKMETKSLETELDTNSICAIWIP